MLLGGERMEGGRTDDDACHCRRFVHLAFVQCRDGAIHIPGAFDGSGCVSRGNCQLADTTLALLHYVLVHWT